MGIGKDFYVYLWTNLVNGKQYVGKGSGPRATEHCRPSCESTLAKAIHKYGRDNFELRYLATDLDETTAFAMEAHAVCVLESKAPNGYNLSEGGKGGTTGWRHTQEAKERLALANTGRYCSAETRAKISEIHRGKTMPPHVAEALLRANKGRKLSEEHRRKLGEAGRGRRQTPEAIEKTAAFHRGRKRSPETCRKISERGKARPFKARGPSPLRGRSQTPEHIAKRVLAIATAKAEKS